MADNPFDVFAAGFQAAVPKPPEEAKDSSNGNNGTINIMANPAPAPVPVMNTPVMNAGPPGGMGGNMMGQSMSGGMMYGGQQPGAPMQQQPYMGGSMAMGRHPSQPPTNALVPSAQQSNPYASMLGGPPPMAGVPPPMAAAPAGYGQAPPMPFGQAPPPGQHQPYAQQFSSGASVAGSVYSQPPASTPARQPTFMQQQPPPSPSPFGSSAPVPQQPPAASDLFGAPVPPSQAMPPQPPPAAPPVFDPVAPTPAPPAPAPPAPAPPAPAADPWATQPEPAAGAIVPSTADPGADPFGIFGTAAPAPPAPAPAAPAPAPTPIHNSDPWSDMGFAPAPAAPAPAAPSVTETTIMSAPAPAVNPPRKDGDLPAGGEWYDAKIFTPTLGVMFFKPQELTDSLFLQTEKTIVDALDERPVVAFIVEGSSARSAGVELGHVLLKVNGIDVKNPKEASRLIKEGPRPLPLLFYVPDTTVVVAEGEHMVKYDSRETTAPNSAKDWKPKYVVIGGIIAQPWMMNMYRSKSEYDIAVIETQARRPVSVKVKQFSLQGARIQNDWQGPQMVKYKNKMHPWKYVVVLPVSRNPIKISSPNLSQLKPVHEGIRRVLMAQQRDRGSQGGNQYSSGGGRTADPYGPQRSQNTNPYGNDTGAQRYENAGGVSGERRTSQY